VRKRNALFVKDVYVSADRIASRNSFCRGAGLKIEMDRTSTVEGMPKLTESRMEAQAVILLKH
jgi:hypothetical protein